jgi:hypothetical protein
VLLAGAFQGGPLPSLFDVKREEWPAITRSTAEALSVSMNGEDDLRYARLTY